MHNTNIHVEDNYYHVSKETHEHINGLFQMFFDKVETIINSHESSENLDINGFILLISEFYDYFVDQDRWLENLYKLFQMLKTQIENGFIRGSSLFGGLGGAAMATYNAANFTGYYEKLLQTINMLLEADTENYIEFVTKNINDLCASHYDTITGLAGTANYLLLDSSKNRDLLNRISDYFALLCNSYKDGQTSLPRWFIKRENIAGPNAKDNYDRGCINFSLSHGMAGPLFVLSKTYALCSDSNKSIMQSIRQLLSLYEEWGCPNEYNVLHWPGQLKIESYLSKQYSESLNNQRCSWCYGTIGISHALLAASRNINDNHLSSKYFDNIEKLCREPLQNHCFSSPHICHGCAGELMIINKWNRIIKSESLENRIMELLDTILLSYHSNYIYGFRNYEYDWKTETHQYTDDISFLEGTTGIMLVLLSLLKTDACLYENHLLL